MRLETIIILICSFSINSCKFKNEHLYLSNFEVTELKEIEFGYQYLPEDYIYKNWGKRFEPKFKSLYYADTLVSFSRYKSEGDYVMSKKELLEDIKLKELLQIPENIHLQIDNSVLITNGIRKRFIRLKMTPL